VPHCFIYVWRYGVQCRGVDGRPGESHLWQDVMACPVSVQEQLRGWRRRGFSLGRRLGAGSRVRLTRGRRAHSSRRGGVSSLRTPTAQGMAIKCPGWRWGGGDSCTGPTATEMTGPASLTSQRSPVRAWSSRPSLLEGSAVLFRGHGTSVVREWATQCHGTDTGHAAQRRTVAGMASPGELVEQCWGVIPRCIVARIRL
jgi:hypothetical protein